MKKSIVLMTSIVIMLLVIGYQTTWIHSIRKNQNAQNAEIIRNECEEMDEFQEAMLPEDSGLIKKNTEIIINSYDENGTCIGQEVMEPNADIIGMSRLDLMEYANDYKKQAPEEECREGLERMVVQAFSSDRVLLVKYYGKPIEEPGYWIAVKDNIVIVYNEDKSEIYEFTNIELWQLPLDVQYDIVDGIYVKNERELFDFLQTYSS